MYESEFAFPLGSVEAKVGPTDQLKSHIFLRVL